MSIDNYLSSNSRDLLNYLNECDPEIKKQLLSDSNIKKKIITDSDKYPFIWLVQSLNKELLETFLDKEGINLLINSSNLLDKLDALITLENDVVDHLLCDDKIIEQIYINYEELYTYLSTKSIEFVQKFFDQIIDNNLNINKLFCFKNLYQILNNQENLDKFIELYKKNSYNFINYDKKTIEVLLNNSYFQNIVLDDNYNIIDLVNKKIKFNDQLLKNPKFINKFIDNLDINKYRFMINNFQQNNNLIYYNEIETKRKKYYDEIINSYNENYDMFQKYVDIMNSLITNNKLIDQSNLFKLNLNTKLFSNDIYELNMILFNRQLSETEKIKKIKKLFQKITHIEFGEILVDRYYEDITYNFKLDLKNLINFNKQNLTINQQNMSRYETILDILENQKINIDFYHSLDKNSIEQYYDDYMLSRKKSYQMINDQLVDCSKIKQQKNINLSKQLGVDIYEFTGQPFYLMLHNTSISKTSNTLNVFTKKRKFDGTSLSLISDRKMNYFGEYDADTIILGFNNLNVDNFVHVYNSDSFSGYNRDSGIASTSQNKLYTPDTLIEETINYNEIVYQVRTENTKYMSKDLYPSYIITFNEITTADIEVAKKFLIPIIKIDKTKYNVNKRQMMYNNLPEEEKYIFSYNELQNKHR